jgi:hypothetical protein
MALAGADDDRWREPSAPCAHRETSRWRAVTTRPLAESAEDFARNAYVENPALRSNWRARRAPWPRTGRSPRRRALHEDAHEAGPGINASSARATRALGRSLRVLGLRRAATPVCSTAEAVTVLDGSPVKPRARPRVWTRRWHRARRAARTGRASRCAIVALDLATVCGAEEALAEHARSELHATGARPRSTPGRRRVDAQRAARRAAGRRGRSSRTRRSRRACS